MLYLLTKPKEEAIMAKYVDGFVLVVPDNKADEYTKMAEEDKERYTQEKSDSEAEKSDNESDTKKSKKKKTLCFNNETVHWK